MKADSTHSKYYWRHAAYWKLKRHYKISTKFQEEKLLYDEQNLSPNFAHPTNFFPLYTAPLQIFSCSYFINFNRN